MLTPLQAHDSAANQGHTDDHIGTIWDRSSFIFTKTSNNRRRVYVGSHTLIHQGLTEKYIAVACSAKQDSLIWKILQSYGLNGATLRYVAEIDYPQDSSHRWDVFGTHTYKNEPPLTTYYGLRYP